MTSREAWLGASNTRASPLDLECASVALPAESMLDMPGSFTVSTAASLPGLPLPAPYAAPRPLRLDHMTAPAMAAMRMGTPTPTPTPTPTWTAVFVSSDSAPVSGQSGSTASTANATVGTSLRRVALTPYPVYALSSSDSPLGTSDGCTSNAVMPDMSARVATAPACHLPLRLAADSSAAKSQGATTSVQLLIWICTLRPRLIADNVSVVLPAPPGNGDGASPVSHSLSTMSVAPVASCSSCSLPARSSTTRRASDATWLKGPIITVSYRMLGRACRSARLMLVRIMSAATGSSCDLLSV
mmetsp:Transcript_17519/g.44121  ORF Transcript_17519/g.44121 Transcript_17519/m.44121 type:complete len:300 (+) Transcript_17519:1309-2208(+)